MHCNFRGLRVNAEIVYWHALKLRHVQPGHAFRLGPRARRGEIRALERLQTAFAGEALPELERVVGMRRPYGAGRVREVLARCGDALEAVARSRLVLMDTCAVDAQGRIAIGTSLAGTVREVRAGDELLSGAYLYADLRRNTVTIGPRFVRPARWSAFSLPGTRIEPGDDVARILRGSALERVRRVVGALSGLTWIPVDEPVEALAALGIHVPAARRELYQRAFASGRERTLYAALCALADLARDEGALDHRLRLERLAGDAVLACAPLGEARAAKASRRRRPRAEADPAGTHRRSG
ncbi:MAG: hypothetical protein QNJ98_04810 [Planctomycetota bacterium]|nr:hypothetical protein [Planctomycetota bacterium]